MSNFLSLVDDQIPAPIKQPNGVLEFRPILEDITLYNDDKGKLIPNNNLVSNTTHVNVKKGMSFKEWKLKQEQNNHQNLPLMNGNGNNDILCGVKKHVRFDKMKEPQSLPIIPETTVATNTTSTTTLRSLPPTLIQNPVEHRMELSICDAALIKQQQQQPQLINNQIPIFHALYQQANVIPVMPVKENPSTMSTIQQTSQPCQFNHQTFQPQFQYQDIRTQALEKKVESLQEQIFLLQQQMSYVLTSIQQSASTTTSSNVSPVRNSQSKHQSSNPFLSAIIQEDTKEKPQMIDTATQYTIIEQSVSHNDVQNNMNSEKSQETHKKSDNTFFNQVLGQVNKILDNSEENNNNTDQQIDNRSCKYIDSDTSAVSFMDETPLQIRERKLFIDSRKNTDKSTVMDSLAAKYLADSYNTDNIKEEQDASRNNKNKFVPKNSYDVSTTCYDYMKKYDLLKNYTDEEDILEKKSMKSTKNYRKTN